MLEMFDDLIFKRLSEGQIEYRTQHKNGAWRVFRASARPLHDETGRISGVIASARDITEQQRLQQQLIQSERLAAMGQMIAGVAHELNNPLTAILGVTELLRDQSADENQSRQLDLAHRQARRAAHIVQSLLVFSRPSTPRNTLLHLPDLLQRTLQLHEHSLRANHIQVDFAARPDLPTVLGDSNQLTQVFLNLIVNAEQAINEVRDRGTLRIRLGVVGERVLITFQDDGVGIRRELAAPHFRSVLYDQAPRPRHRPGTQHLHGDYSRAQRRYFRATAARWRLGLHRLAAGLHAVGRDRRAACVSGERRPGGAALIYRPASSSHKKILVVDDEESILELVGDSLTARGYLVDRASSPDVALDLANRNSYDVVLCDLNLESAAGTVVSGFDLHGQILGNIVGPVRPAPLFHFHDRRLDRRGRQRTSRARRKPLPAKTIPNG